MGEIPTPMKHCRIWIKNILLLNLLATATLASNNIESRLEVIVEEQRAARAEQRILDRQRAESYRRENRGTEEQEEVSEPSNCDWYLSSWYGSLPGDSVSVDGYHGRTAANGSTFNTHSYTLAHKTLPFGTVVSIKKTDGSYLQATVTDRGPYSGGRVFDFSRAIALSAQTSTGGTLYGSGVGSVYVCFD